ncbi:MAG: hybrid sensor histidine kinase/response regulator [Pirellulaceae bacterium]
MASILVVDDTPDMVMLMTMAVKKQGYTALTATSGLQALELAAAMRPDVILLDIMMPGMDGIQVLSTLKQDPTLCDIPVILVTAKGEDDDVITGLDAGAHDYVTKPFKREVLAARMRSAVRIKQHHDTLLKLTHQLQTEITERVRMQRELAQAQKLESIGHLAAGIAHEINTPAQYVGDNTRFLQDVFSDVDELLGDLDQLLDAARQGTITEELIADVDQRIRQADVPYIKDQAPKAIQQSLEGIERVASIVRAMKEFSHPGTGEKRPVDMNRAIESTVTVSRNEWKYVAELVTDYDPELPLVPCRAGDLNQVVLNLLLNAAQAIASVVGDGVRGKGTITVTTRHRGDWAEIRIRDTGRGIPASIRDKVFDQFFTTKDVGKGTGLGLSITHALVQNHGGTIGFETEEGQGTVFIVCLPLCDATV